MTPRREAAYQDLTNHNSILHREELTAKPPSTSAKKLQVDISIFQSVGQVKLGTALRPHKPVLQESENFIGSLRNQSDTLFASFDHFGTE